MDVAHLDSTPRRDFTAACAFPTNQQLLQSVTHPAQGRRKLQEAAGNLQLFDIISLVNMRQHLTKMAGQHPHPL